MRMIRAALWGIASVIAPLAVCASSAFADGMERRRPLMAAPAPVAYTWSGFYAGAQVGGLWSDVDGEYVVAPLASFSPSQSAGLWGGHIGIQHQLGHWVVGAEASLLSTFNDSLDDSPCVPAVCGNSLVSGIENMYTVGGRLGWARGSWMPYVAGGYANARVETRTAEADPEATRVRHHGWYIGGGIDWAVTPNVILGVEYRHYEFADKTAVPSDSGGPVPDDRWNVDPSADTVMARLSYKFRSPLVGR